MSRNIKSFSDEEIETIALKCMAQMFVKFGEGRYKQWVKSEPEMAHAFFRFCWLEIRTALLVNE